MVSEIAGILIRQHKKQKGLIFCSFFMILLFFTFFAILKFFYYSLPNVLFVVCLLWQDYIR